MWKIWIFTKQADGLEHARLSGISKGVHCDSYIEVACYLLLLPALHDCLVVREAGLERASFLDTFVDQNLYFYNHTSKRLLNQ